MLTAHARPMMRRIISTVFAGAALVCTSDVARAEMQPLVPYRLTHNGPGEFTYVTGGRIGEIGYTVRDEGGGASASLANAFVFLDGQQTLALSNITAPNRFAKYVGSYDGRFIVSEGARIVPPPSVSTWSENLILHDGQTGVPITHNPPGVVSRLSMRFGELLFVTLEYGSTSQNPVRSDVYHYTSAGSVNLTNNPISVHSDLAPGGQPGHLFVFQSFQQFQFNPRNLLYSRLDGTPAVNITQHGPGRIVTQGVYGVPGMHLFGVADVTGPTTSGDMVLFDGTGTTNLTNNPPGTTIGLSRFAGPDAIFSQSTGTTPATTRWDLLRYRDGVLTNFTNNSPGQQSTVQHTIGSDVIFHTHQTGTDMTGRSSLHRNNGVTNVALTHNPSGTYASLAERLPGDDLLFRIQDRRSGFFPDVRRTDLFFYDGTASINLSNNPIGVHSRSGGAFGERGVAFGSTDYRHGFGSDQLIDDLFIYDGTAVHRLSNNAPGMHSVTPRQAGPNIVFHTTTSPAALRVTDVMLYDGQSSRNITNLAPQQFGSYSGIIGSDLLISVRDTSSTQTLVDLRRYMTAGSFTSISQSEPGTVSTLLEIRNDRAVWFNVEDDNITGVFSGDGFSPIDTVYEPPAGQTISGLSTSWRGLPFFLLEGGSGAEHFTNILVYFDGQVVPLTDNGPGWYAYLYLPPFLPNDERPDAAFPDVAVIGLHTVNGDRRDVIVVALPEPGTTPLLLMSAILLRRRRR